MSAGGSASDEARSLREASGAAHRLYGTLIDPVEGHFKLGYVDLSNGRVYPDVDGPINKNLGTATGYLERLRDRSPLGERGRVTG